MVVEGDSVHRLFQTLLVLSVVIAGCGGSAAGRSDEPWDQSWHLTSIQTPDGVLDDAGIPKPVYISFRPDLRGSDGCDLFEGSYNYVEPTLSFPTIEYTYAEANPGPAECPEQYLPIVEAVRSALNDGVDVTELTRDVMVWRWEQNDTVFEFHPGVEG